MPSFSTLWKRLGDISLAQWLFAYIVPAIAGGGGMAWITHFAQQAGWVVALVGFAGATLAVWFIAAAQHQKHHSIERMTSDELRSRVRDAHLAEMLGKDDAERAFRSRTMMASLGLAKTYLVG